MALNFEIKLSFKCCTLLAALIAYNDFLDQQQDPDLKNTKKRKGLDKWSEFMPEYSHFLSHAGVLKRQNLVETNGWKVTEKGKLVARVLEIEMQETKDLHQKINKALKAKVNQKQELV